MAELKDLLADANSIKTELLLLLKGKSEQEIIAIKKSNDGYRAQVKLLKKINDQVQGHRKLNTDKLESISEQESGLKSMTSIYQSMGNTERKRLELIRNTNTSITTNIQSLGKMQDISKEISELTSDDITQRALLQRQYELEKDSLDLRGAGIQEQIRLSDEVNNRASQFANLTEKQKNVLEQQLSVYDGIKNTLGGILDTASMVTKSTGGMVGMITIGMGIFADKVADVNKELGFTVRELNKANTSAAGLSLFFDDTAGTVKGLTNEFGTMEEASGKTQLQVGLMATNLGISNIEATTLVGSFARMNDGSSDIAADMIATTKEFAKQNNVIPSDVLSDLAGSSEIFALHAKRGGENLIKAAVGARQLGVSLETVTSIGEGLLDFESSITKELELSAILGRSINLNKARGLAYDGKMEEATRETLKQLGGIDAFNRMDYFQKKQSADLLGTSVAELQKMVSNEKNVVKQGSLAKETFDEMGQSLDAGLNKYLGTSLKGLGGMVMMAGQFNMGLGMMRNPISKLGSGLKGIGKKLGSIIGIGSKTVTSPGPGIGKAVTQRGVPDMTKSTQSSKGMSSFTNGIQKMNPVKLLAGAAAMVIVAGALWVFGKAVQEFSKVSWGDVGKAVVGLLALTAAVIGLGMIMASGVGALAILAGAAAMILMAGAVVVLGAGVNLLADGFERLGSDITGPVASLMGMGNALGMVADQLDRISPEKLDALSNFSMVASIGASVTSLAGSIGGLINSVSGIEQSTSLSEYESQMLKKMDILIDEVKSNRDIYLDKDKVTNTVMKVSERRTKNIFGLEVA